MQVVVVVNIVIVEGNLIRIVAVEGKEFSVVKPIVNVDVDPAAVSEAVREMLDKVPVKAAKVIPDVIWSTIYPSL